MVSYFNLSILFVSSLVSVLGDKFNLIWQDFEDFMCCRCCQVDRLLKLEKSLPDENPEIAPRAKFVSESDFSKETCLTGGENGKRENGRCTKNEGTANFSFSSFPVSKNLKIFAFLS